MEIKTSFAYFLLSSLAEYLTILNKLKQAQLQNELNCDPEGQTDLTVAKSFESVEFIVFANFCLALCDFIIRLTVTICLGDLEKIEAKEMKSTMRMCIIICFVAIALSNNNIIIFAHGESKISIQKDIQNLCEANPSFNDVKVQINECLNSKVIYGIRGDMCCFAKSSTTTYEFILDHMKTLSFNRELKMIIDFMKQNFRFFSFLVLSIQISLTILRHGSSVRCTEMWSKKNSIISLMKMLALFSILLIIYIPEVLFFSFSEEINSKSNGIFGFHMLEMIISWYIAYEIFEVLESFSKIMILLLLKLCSFHSKTLQSVYLIIIQGLVTCFISIYTLGTYFGIQIFIINIIRIVFQFEEMATNLIAICHISDMFKVTKSEILQYDLDQICILCQSEIEEGVLLCCNHVYHQECFKHSYLQSQNCLNCQKYIEFPHPVSNLQNQISKERNCSL